MSETGIYKAEILIKGINDTYLKEVETDQDGDVKVLLPKGTYQIDIQKNGYGKMSFRQQVLENKNIDVKKVLKPKEVIYDSFFLGGVIGEKSLCN